jgi:hypothetical protein
MRKVAKTVILMAAFALLTATQASAQQYPNVKNQKPFSAATNFMSLPGYLRWVVFQQTQNWITYAEASRIVAQQ